MLRERLFDTDPLRKAWLQSYDGSRFTTYYSYHLLSWVAVTDRQLPLPLSRRSAGRVQILNGSDPRRSTTYRGFTVPASIVS